MIIYTSYDVLRAFVFVPVLLYCIIRPFFYKEDTNDIVIMFITIMTIFCDTMFLFLFFFLLNQNFLMKISITHPVSRWLEFIEFVHEGDLIIAAKGHLSVQAQGFSMLEGVDCSLSISGAEFKKVLEHEFPITYFVTLYISNSYEKNFNEPAAFVEDEYGNGTKLTCYKI